MHTTEIGRTRFHHNGDYSGCVDVVEVGPGGETGNLVNTPMVDIEQFVAEKQRSLLVAYIESLDLSRRYNRMKVEDLTREAGC